MTINELVKQGMSRIRLPEWADPDDYLLLHIVVEGTQRFCGPWGYLYSPIQQAMGLPRPAEVLIVADREDRWDPFTGSPAEDERRL